MQKCSKNTRSERQGRCHSYIQKAKNPWRILKKNVIQKNEEQFIISALGKCQKVLDACGGTGSYSSVLLGTSEIVVIDSSTRMLVKGRELYPEIEFVNHSVLDMPFADDEFDGVLIRANLMYFSDSERIMYLREIKRVTKPGSVIAIIDRSSKDFMYWYTLNLIKMDPFESKNDFMDRQSLTLLLKSIGLELNSFEGYFFSRPSLRRIFAPRRIPLKARFSPVRSRKLERIFKGRYRWMMVKATNPIA